MNTPNVPRAEFRAICLISMLVIAYLFIGKLAPSGKIIVPPQIHTITTTDVVTTGQEAMEYRPAHTTHYKVETRRTQPGKDAMVRVNTKYVADRTARPVNDVTRCSPFDPNTVAVDSLIAWGITNRVASNLDSYRSKGGTFRSSKDVSKIYGMDSISMRRLQTCMEFKEAPRKTMSASSTLCINRASTDEWVQLYGIGPVLANRIVKFREALGGFLSIDQVANTYGLPPETFESIRSHLTIKATHELMPVNTMTAEALASHPYISFREARAITNYIKNHGALKSDDALYGIHVLDADRISQIKPYLQFEVVDVAAVQE